MAGKSRMENFKARDAVLQRINALLPGHRIILNNHGEVIGFYLEYPALGWQSETFDAPRNLLAFLNAYLTALRIAAQSGNLAPAPADAARLENDNPGI